MPAEKSVLVTHFHVSGRSRDPQMSPTIFLVLLGILALAGMLVILLPFVGPIVLAGAVSITAYPVYRWTGRRWPRLSPGFRALVTDLAILTLILLPVLLLIWTAAGEAGNFRPVLSRWIAANQAIHQGRLDDSPRALRPIPETMPAQSGLGGAQETAWMLGYAARGLDQLADWAAQAVAALLQGAAVTLVLCPFITFFLLRDGPAYVERVLSGRITPGVLVLAWGIGMVLCIDNFAAPWLVGHRLRVGLLSLVFGILGGAAVFGVKGLLIGPLIVSIAPTVFELVRHRVFGPERGGALDELRAAGVSRANAWPEYR